MRVVHASTAGKYGATIRAPAAIIIMRSMMAPKRCWSSTWTSLARASMVAGVRVKGMRRSRGCNGSYAAVTTARRKAPPFVPAASTSCRLAPAVPLVGFPTRAYHYDRACDRLAEFDGVVVSDPLQRGFATTSSGSWLNGSQVNRRENAESKAIVARIIEVYSQPAPVHDYNRKMSTVQHMVAREFCKHATGIAGEWIVAVCPLLLDFGSSWIQPIRAGTIFQPRLR